MTTLSLFEVGFSDAVHGDEPFSMIEEYMAGYNAGLISRLYA